MKTLKRIVVIITFLLGAGLSEISTAQHKVNPREISQLSEALGNVKREWTYTFQDKPTRGTSLSDAGLVFVTGDSDVTQTIDRDGTTVWERRAPEGMGTVSAWSSPNGRYVYLVHRVYDEGGIFVLITSEGQTLWQKDLNGQKGWPRFSRDGDYILTDPYILYWKPFEVVESRTGNTLWSKDRAAVSSFESGLDHLVYIENTTISNVDLTNGHTRWTHSFDVTSLGDRPGLGFWSLESSEEGKKLAVAVEKSFTTRLGTFDQTGNLLWRQDVDGVETLLGITPNGRFLATETGRPDHRQLKLIDADIGVVIWTLQTRVDGRNFVVMNDRLLFNTADGILILTIDSLGRLLDQALLPRKSIEYVGLRIEPGSTQDRSLEKTVLMLMDTELERTFYIESIER